MTTAADLVEVNKKFCSMSEKFSDMDKQFYRVEEKFFAVSMLFYLDKRFFMGESMILHMNLSMTCCCLGMDLNLVNHTQQRYMSNML